MVRRLSSSLSPSLSPCWQSLQRLFQMVIKGVWVISMAKLFGLLGTAWAGWTGEHKHREFPRQFPSRWQLPVAAGSDSLAYRLACWKHATTFSTLTQFKGQFFWMFCRLRQQQALLFFMWHEIFYGIGKSCCQPKQHPSLCSIFQSVIGLWVEIWLGTKTACSESNPVQSSRSKSMTCPRKVHLLKFK